MVVVIGVHSPKFDNEKKSESVRKAILRYEITHPVVNDANLVLWRRFGVASWPSFILIDPEGRYRGRANGEGLYLLSWSGERLPAIDAQPGMLQTQAATTSVFAWLAVYPPPA